jgi:hypothetical protein
LLVTDFTDTSSAWDADEMRKSMEDGRTVAIDGISAPNGQHSP